MGSLELLSRRVCWSTKQCCIKYDNEETKVNTGIKEDNIKMSLLFVYLEIVLMATEGVSKQGFLLKWVPLK